MSRPRFDPLKLVLAAFDIALWTAILAEVLL